MPSSENEKLQVQQATDIVRLIGEQLALKPKGKEFLGLCPFHDDQNPSLHVSPVKQIYKCFSCGAGGDVFSFVMGYHKLSFPEAIEYLAQRSGITLNQQKNKKDGQSSDKRKAIASANQLALGFFQRYLTGEKGEKARNYLTQRNITLPMVDSFSLGLSPDSWDELARHVTQKKWDVNGFEATGLISKRDSGGYYDKLRGRVIFPIFDAIGRPIAFGGRKIDDQQEGPKYLNSPETPLFNKSATLYGIHLAKKGIIDSKTAVIVEGYTDAIACHQAGINNVVATLGTAFTKQHAGQLCRYAEKLILIFDPDQAGQKAADRAVEIFLTENTDVFISSLPDGLDPADLMRKEDGLAQWQAAMDSASDALEYQFSRISSQIDSAGTITGRQHVIEQYLRYLGQSGLERVKPLRKTFILQRLAQLLHLDEQKIARLISAATPRRVNLAAESGQDVAHRPDAESGDNPSGNSILEPDFKKNTDFDTDKFALSESAPKIKSIATAQLQLIGCILQDNSLFHHTIAGGTSVDEALLPQEMEVADHRKLYQKMYDRLADGQPVTLASLLAELAANGQQPLANLATEADALLDKLTTNNKDKPLIEILELALKEITDYKMELDYLRQRPSLATQDIKKIDRIVREQFSRPSAVRIARKKTNP